MQGANGRENVSGSFLVLMFVYTTLLIIGFGMLSVVLFMFSGMCLAGLEVQQALGRLTLLSFLLMLAGFVVVGFLSASRLWGLRLAALYYLGYVVLAAVVVTLPARAISCLGVEIVALIALFIVGAIAMLVATLAQRGVGDYALSLVRRLVLRQ